MRIQLLTLLRRKSSRFALLFALFLPVWIQAQIPSYTQSASTGIKNFGRLSYQGASQNWAVSSGTGGFVFFANNYGLLEFDGTNWQLHRLPNETILRAVLAVSDSLIYTSGYRKLGYWTRDKRGKLNYHSLYEQAEKYILKNDEFWDIEVHQGKVYFHSFYSLLVYENGEINHVELPDFSATMQLIGEQLILAIKDRGLFKFEKNGLVPFLVDPVFNGKTIRFIQPYHDGQLLIGTTSHGIYLVRGKTVSQWHPEWTDFFDKNELNRACLSGGGDLILGTILNGIVIFDKNEQLKAQFNSNDGLQNNTVLGIATDQFDNIWLGLDRGVSFIAGSVNTGISIETIPNIGAVYTAAIFNGNLYLGTNQGLFKRALEKHEQAFDLVPGTQGQIWDSKVIGNQLFVGFNEGTMLITPEEPRLISTRSGGFSIQQDSFDPNLLIQSTYSDLVVYEKQGNSYRHRNYIGGFNDLIRYIEIDHHGAIWASHMHRGIFKLKLDDKRTKVVDEKYFGEHSVFGKDHSLKVFKVENRVVFTTNDELYTYDDLNDSIIPYGFLNASLGQFARSHRIVEAPNHHYWFITDNAFALFFINNNTVQLVHAYPFSVFNENPLIDEFENIYPISEKQAIVCLEDGIAWVDAGYHVADPPIYRFHPNLQEIQLLNRGNNRLYPLLDEKQLQVKNAYNNLIFKFSFPHFTNDPVYYQAFLEGLSQEWSEKTQSPIFRFDRVPAGTYTLRVKAIDSWGYQSREFTKTIEIMPAWYNSVGGRLVFILLILIVLLIIRWAGIRKIRRQEQLEHDRRERELIRLRNEKLNAEVTHKSKELANSTMSMIKKNEFLLNLRKIVSDQKEQLGSRYPDKYFLHLTQKIDENIGSHDDWKIFETNFEQAHELFLKKLKDDYPDLTNKDLRLCAYLRMNLSSKEIAPLLGISVRGEENHRYRLRKKMGMEHDDTLIDFILKY
ncbi:MAG: regulator [Mangrovibacterium sp.]